MKRIVLNIKNFYSSVLAIWKFLDGMGVKPVYFAVISLLSMTAAFFEGISVSLLIPIMKGIGTMDFSFVKEAKVVKNIIGYFPSFFEPGNTCIFVMLVAAVVFAATIKNILRYFAMLLIAYRARKFTSDLRKLIFNRYLTFGKLFFDRSNKGYLCNIPTHFVPVVVDHISTVQFAIDAFFAIVVYFIIMIIISWKFTMVVFIFYPVLHYSLQLIIKKIKKTSHFYADATRELNEKIYNVVSCMPLVKCYANERKEKREFSYISDTIAKWQYSLDKKQALIGPLQETIILVGLLLCVSAVAFLVMRNHSGDLASFLVYFYVIKKSADAFGPINIFRSSIASVSGHISKISEVLDDKDKFFIKGGMKEFEGLKRGIEFRNLFFSYIREIQVLHDASFFVEKGRMTAIVGPTGAGKTTLVNLILRFYDCPPSSIFVDGTDIREFDLKSLLTHVALVSQDTLLFNDTLKHNIIYGLNRIVSDEELTDIVKKARLYDFVMKLPDSFDTLIGDRGVKLSGGERQRVSIARAMLKGSEILILDEATSSLDTETERLIQMAIDEAVKGRTTIVIAHRLSTIRNADRILVIEDGRLVEEGALNELLDKKGKFYQYWEKQKFY